MNISEPTLFNWQKKYPYFKELIAKTREDSAKECIEVGLRKLATGSKDITTTDSFVTETTVNARCEITGEMIRKVVPVNRTISTKEKAPDSKALEILSRKYDKEFTTKEIEVTNTTVNLLEGFNMRDLQEARKLNPIDAEYKEIDSDSDSE